MVSFGPGMANPQKPHSERSIACQPWAKIGLSHSRSNHVGNRLAGGRAPSFGCVIANKDALDSHLNPQNVM